MKKQYTEPETEVIRYQEKDIILTSSHHHCGVGIVTGHDYVDSNGNSWCEDEEDFHCGNASGDYVECHIDCDIFCHDDDPTCATVSDAGCNDHETRCEDNSGDDGGT